MLTIPFPAFMHSRCQATRAPVRIAACTVSMLRPSVASRRPIARPSLADSSRGVLGSATCWTNCRSIWCTDR